MKCHYSELNISSKLYSHLNLLTFATGKIMTSDSNEKC